MIQYKVHKWVKLFGIIPLYRKTYYIYDIDVFPNFFITGEEWQNKPYF